VRREEKESNNRFFCGIPLSLPGCVVCSPAITVSSFPDMDMETWLKRGGIYPPSSGLKN